MRALEIFPPLCGLADRRGGSLSGGEQQMLAVARTLVGEPAVLLLDEPSEGLAPRLVQNMADHVLRMKQEGLTVVLAEQNLHFATRVSDRAYILEKGSIRYEGTMQELRNNAEVRRRYLMV